MPRYLVLTRRRPAFDPAVIGPHCAFPDELRAEYAQMKRGPDRRA